LPVELFAYFEIESTSFEKVVFCLFDEGCLLLYNFGFFLFLKLLMVAVNDVQTNRVISILWSSRRLCGIF
jgi:hypothetical protein